MAASVAFPSRRFLYGLLVAHLIVSASAEPTCTKDRFLNDCGYVGISQGECEGNGCCYDPTVPEKEPWCYYKNGGYKYFSTTLDRVNCGYFGIFRSKCEDRGCMFDPAFGKPWCFYPNTNIDQERCPSARTECGHLGIKQDECEGKDCCWSPLEEGSAEPWCFKATPATAAPSTDVPSPDETGEGIAVRSRPEEETAEGEGETTAQEGSATIEEFDIGEAISRIAGLSVPLGEETPVAASSEPAVEDVNKERLQDETYLAMELGRDKDIKIQPINIETIKLDWNLTPMACGSSSLTENECLAIAGCYWAASADANGQKCFRELKDPSRLSLGKFWKPENIL